ncbi:MAG: hypothetical protein IJ643_07635 [Eubacterium sp.]|nr:hypothetical protein [Eubacterium sp.]
MAVISRIKNSKTEEKSVLKQYGLFAVYFVLGFVLSFGKVVGDITPFGV